MKHILALITIALLSSCASQNKITNTPDLKVYSFLTIKDSNGKADQYDLKLSNKSAFSVFKLDESTGKLFVQPNECRNQEKSCERRFMITGDVIHNKNNLKCFFELRNDVNEGYQGQIIEGLCRDKFNRNFSSSIHQ